jgi:hypothetical protein
MSNASSCSSTSYVLPIRMCLPRGFGAVLPVSRQSCHHLTFIPHAGPGMGQPYRWFTALQNRIAEYLVNRHATWGHARIVIGG